MLFSNQRERGQDMDFTQRDEWEARIAERLGRLSEQQRREIMRLLGDPPDIGKVTPAYWTQHAQELQGVLGSLEDVFLQSAANYLADNPALGVDWTLVNRNATDWARGYWNAGGMPDPMYPGALVARFTENHKRELGDLIARFYEEGWNIGKLRERLVNVFGPVWSEMVATTEVTRAAVQGERTIIAELEKLGVTMREVWQTRNDEMVCPICGPRHGKPSGDGWTQYDGPPAHPRCRCWIGHEMVMPK